MDMGVAGDRRSDTPMDMATEMTTAATPILAETVGATLFERIERDENRKRRSSIEAPATAGDWRSSLE
jgi:hypothetical protein